MFSSKTTRRSLSRESSRTGSTTRLVRKNGELFGVAHKVPSSRPARDDRFIPETTYDSMYVTPVTSDQLHPTHKRPHTAPKPLVPYKLTAPRNLLPIRFPNENANRRFLRNASQFSLKDGSNSERTRFKTVHQVSFQHAPEGLPVGFDNKGILSEKTKWFHKRQLD